jgi:tripartite ATP-independent transporter DctM subunit
MDAASIVTGPLRPDGIGAPVTRLARAARFGDGILGGVVATVAALLVLAEIGILGSGVFARYVLQRPLIWSDELASILFLWLSMLGAVLAIRRGEHMRMTGLVNRVRPGVQQLLEAFALAASLALLLMILAPAIEHAQDESFVVTPALEVSSAWRASALPVGVMLMIAAALLRLARLPSWRVTLLAAGLVAATVLMFWLAGPAFAELDNANLLIFFVGVVGINVFAGVPIAFSFALATYGYLALTTDTPLVVMVGRLDEGMSHEILLAVPLFIFLGALLEMTGMARAMIAFLASLLGRVRGGLSYVLIGAMYLVSGISGSKIADMAAIAPVLFPEMRQRGARPGDLLALLAATGAQTETIPPSIVLITIGSVTGVSIAALFTGGLLPAAVLGVGLCLVVAWRARGEDLRGIRREPARTVVRRGLVAFPALLLPFVIRTAVIEGVATATEVSTIGIGYSVLMGLIVYRQFAWRRLPAMLVETASLTGTILFIIGSATAMAWGLTQSGFSHDLAHWMSQIPGGHYGFLAISIVVFIVLGSVLEGIPAIVLFGPLLFPVARSVGVNEVHYAMVVVFAMGIGLFSPPFGVGYYGACAISKIHPDEGLRHMGVYVAVLLIGLMIVAAVPWLTTGFLPTPF